jgi:hypothetical protein
MRETTIERHATLGYPVPTEPGLGIEINEEALIAQRKSSPTTVHNHLNMTRHGQLLVMSDTVVLCFG